MLGSAECRRVAERRGITLGQRPPRRRVLRKLCLSRTECLRAERPFQWAADSIGLLARASAATVKRDALVRLSAAGHRRAHATDLRRRSRHHRSASRLCVGATGSEFPALVGAVIG